MDVLVIFGTCLLVFISFFSLITGMYIARSKALSTLGLDWQDTLRKAILDGRCDS